MEALVSLVIILSCVGIIIASFSAKANQSTWPSTLQVMGSFLFGIPTILLTITAESAFRGMGPVGGFLLFAIVALGLLLYIIGLIAYCARTFSTVKSNKELDYLNFQIKDRLEGEDSTQP